MAGNRQGAPVGAQNRGSNGVKLGEMADGDGVMKNLGIPKFNFLSEFHGQLEHVGKSFKLGHRKAVPSLGVISTFFGKVTVRWTGLLVIKRGSCSLSITSDCGLHIMSISCISMYFISYANKHAPCRRQNRI